MIEPMAFKLPEAVVRALREIEPAIKGRTLETAAVARVLNILDALPPRAVVRADHELPWILGLYTSSVAKGAFWRPWGSPRANDIAALARVPGLDHLFLFHRDGHVREAALRRIDGGIRSPFFFAAVALRLNDWAVPVRAAAVACADRAFPATDPAVVGAAAMFLLEQRYRWLRWSPAETGPLDRALQRTAVAGALVESLCRAGRGPVGRLLRSALRGPGFDSSLEPLATSARLPDIRGIALQALIERRVRWPSYRQKQWIDKSMGRYREGWAYASRPVEHAMTIEAAVALAARDRSAAVRRLAVIALLTRHRALANFDEVAAILAVDRNAVLRERTAFALDMQTGAATAG
ncbi:MAG: hypothetical protein V4574_13430 [Pseudomonadota bacterium]